jgi:DNA-binding FadR family transcriptional regulator
VIDVAEQLPFLFTRGRNDSERLQEVIDYIHQLREELEGILMNLTADNLSSEIIKKIQDVGISTSINEKDKEEIYQIVQNQKSLNVNFETGQLEYTVPSE